MNSAAPDTLEKSALLRRFEELLAPQTDAALESMAQTSRALTLRHFGRAMRLFAPLYLSNECINNCRYCGFSRDNPILRVTLEIEEVLKEARHLAKEGFRNILLVAGEHPKFVSNGYLEMCVRKLAPEIASVSLEVGPMETADYIPLVNAGAGVARGLPGDLPPANLCGVAHLGAEKDYDWRLACPERAYAAGFRRIGVGVLFGLWDWREEALALAEHLERLFRICWQAQITVSLPRLRPAASGFHPRFTLPDREFVQLVCALRICFPQVGIVLSTRESAEFRDALVPLGITMMSAGSATDPGGYTGVGRDALHHTVRGIAVKPAITPPDVGATEQFEIADNRTAGEVAALLRRRGFDPVWKDWDKAILSR